MKILSFVLLLALVSCNTLKVQENYCEIAFAYPTDQELPVTLYKDQIGCACTSKDILKGIEVGAWKFYPLEQCRRLRGFNPKQWKSEIDPFFQYQYERRVKSKEIQ